MSRSGVPTLSAWPEVLPGDEDRWFRFGPERAKRVSVATAGIALVSLALHGAVVATALVPGRPAPPPQQEEIAVEVVHDEPKPPAPPEPKPAEKAPGPAAKTAALDQAEPPQAKPPEAKPPEAKPPEAKPPEAEQPEAKTPPPPEPKLAEKPPEPAKPPPAASAADAELKELTRQVAELEAEQAAAEREAGQAAAQRAAAKAVGKTATMASLGLGPLPDSFQAVALPSASEDADAEPVGYTAIVFSQLAKAKEVGSRLGRPGSAGVHFLIDEHGALVHVELAATSGIKALDDEALGIVRKAAPFPPPPKDAQREFSANVSFVAGPGR